MFLDASVLRERYKAALKRAGLRPLRFHDLRHTFGTRAARRAEVPAVQAWMGYADIHTTMRYVHHRDRGGEAKVLAEAFAVEPVPRPEHVPDVR
jgi:integrase